LANGEKYVGEWRNDKLNGKGTYTWPDGAKYVGQFRDDKRNGHGTFYAADGKVTQSGIWKDGALTQ
jgi:hypothetical protein